MFDIVPINRLPVVCNIPHGLTRVPAEFRGQFELDDLTLSKQVAQLADLFSDELYSSLLTMSGGVISKVSRAVVDIERFEDDSLEQMSKQGMGVVYEKLMDANVVRRVTPAEREVLLSRIFRPYHIALTTLVKQCLREHDLCVIVDCHTFPEYPRPYEPEQLPRPQDICIGADAYHTPTEIIKPLMKHFAASGYSVKVNSPFAGSLVPLDFYRKDPRVVSVMIEVNRRLYMNERTLEKSDDFALVSSDVCGIVEEAISEYLAYCRSAHLDDGDSEK